MEIIMKDWNTLIKHTAGSDFTVCKVHLPESDLDIEGQFELPPLAKLEINDQVFIAAFIKAHGSIKEMEKYFGVSYPTIKNRLNKIADQLGFVEVENTKFASDIFAQIDSGDISVEQALQRLEQ